MGLLGLLRRKKKKNSEPVDELQPEIVTGPELFILIPEVAGAPTYQVNRFEGSDQALEFIGDRLTQMATQGAHVFWALHNDPPPNMSPDSVGGEALVLINSGQAEATVHVVSFVDVDSAQSFARFEVKRGLELGLLMIYWATFIQVIETPFGLRLDPPEPPVYEAKAPIFATAPAPSAAAKESTAANEDAPELRIMAEPKQAAAKETAAERAPETKPAKAEPVQAKSVPEPIAAAEPEEAPTSEQEPARTEPISAAELTAVAEDHAEPGIAIEEQTIDEPVLESDADAEPTAQAETAPEAEPAEAEIVPEPIVVPTAEETKASEQGQSEAGVAAEPDDGPPPTAEDEQTAPEARDADIEAELARAVADLGRRFAEQGKDDPLETSPDPIAIDVPWPTTDEEPPERAAATVEPEDQADNAEVTPDHEPEDATGSTETRDEERVAEEIGPDPEPEAPTVAADEAPVAEPEHEQVEAETVAASANSTIDDANGEGADEDASASGEPHEIEKILKVKRWEKKDKPFSGFDSPPGRF